MQFCKDCGGVLNLFGKNDRELCSSCIQSRKKHQIPEPAPPTGPTEKAAEKRDNNLTELLKDAVLSIENGKAVLRSKQGWELWSASQGSSTELKTVLERAGRIYQIRLRRQKN